MAGNGDIYVRYTNNEPQNPLDCSRWAWKKMYAEETDPLLTEQDKEEYMDAYRMFWKNMVLRQRMSVLECLKMENLLSEMK